MHFPPWKVHVRHQRQIVLMVLCTRLGTYARVILVLANPSSPDVLPAHWLCHLLICLKLSFLSYFTGTFYQNRITWNHSRIFFCIFISLSLTNCHAKIAKGCNRMIWNTLVPSPLDTLYSGHLAPVDSGQFFVAISHRGPSPQRTLLRDFFTSRIRPRFYLPFVFHASATFVLNRKCV